MGTLAGKKTYAVGIIAILLGIGKVFIPDMDSAIPGDAAELIMGGLGAMALRHGIATK